MTIERIFGKHCVSAALNSRLRNPLLKLSVYQPIKNDKRLSKEHQELQNIVQSALSMSIPVEQVTKSLLDQWAAGRPHQNVALTAGPRIFPSLNHWNDNGLAVVLDGLRDPQNVGALIRSAYFLGANSIILHDISLEKSGGTVSKASSGALEAWPEIYATANLSELLKNSPNALKIAASIHHSDIPIKTPRELSESSDRQKPRILVLGSEHEGVSKRVLSQCDCLAYIPSGTILNAYTVDSLNVSAAGSILIHALL